MREFVYVFNCTGIADGALEHLEQMIEGARDITLPTLRRHVDLKEWENEMGYGSWLRLKDDWCVSFHKSKVVGVTCYYIRLSAIEYVFVHENYYSVVRGKMCAR